MEYTVVFEGMSISDIQDRINDWYLNSQGKVITQRCVSESHLHGGTHYTVWIFYKVN